MQGVPDLAASEDIGSLRLELRTRNNRLWHAIYDRWGSVSAFCRDVGGVYAADVGRYLNLKQTPWNKKTGELKKGAARIVEATGRNALWLFDPDLYEQDFLPRETLVAEIDPRLMLTGADELRDVAALGPAPDEVLIAEEELSVSALLDNTLHTLTPRCEDVLRRRFALEPYDRAQTYEAIAEFFDVTRERIRQIEGKALRTLRGPLRGVPLKRAMQGEDPFPPMIDPEELEADIRKATLRRVARRVAECTEGGTTIPSPWGEDWSDDEGARPDEPVEKTHPPEEIAEEWEPLTAEEIDQRWQAQRQGPTVPRKPTFVDYVIAERSKSMEP